MRRSEWIGGLILIALLILVALAGRWARRGGETTCAYDGGRIEPMYRVRFESSGAELEFCCIRCAELWLRSVKDRPSTIRVTDESSGAEFDAAAAWYVRSLVVTNRVTGNRVHVFKHEQDAIEHVRSVGGHVLEDDERPFVAALKDRR